MLLLRSFLWGVAELAHERLLALMAKHGLILYGKDSSPQAAAPPPTSQTVTQTNLSPEAAPYYISLMNRAQDVSQNPYPAYPGQLVADTAPLQNQYISGAQNVANNLPQQATMGTGLADAAGIGALNNAGNAFGYQNAMYSQGNNALNSGINTVNNSFNPANVQNWMNPYQQGVTDIAKQQANLQYANQENTAAGQAASHGALGGYRDQIRGSMDQFNQNTLLNNIQMQGGQQAYNSALQAMGTQGQLGLGEANLGGSLYGQANNAGQLGLASLGQATQAGSALGGLGTQQLAMQQTGLGDLQTAGALQQSQQQNQLSAAYNQFQNASAYPQQQLNFLSGILRGVPSSPSTDVTQYQAPPSVYSQLAGIGMAGAGLGSLAGKIG